MSITVVGEGRHRGEPDIATVTLGVSVEGDSVARARSDAAELATALHESLAAEGIESSDIQTIEYAVHPVHDYRNEHRRLIGYRVTNRVAVTIRALDRAGAIIDRAGATGGNAVIVDGVTFGLEDEKALDDAAREAAWHDALRRAEHLAELAGVALGAPASISETAANQPPIARRMAFVAEAADASTPLQPGAHEASVSLHVTFDT